MNENDKFALVPRPPSALEKAEPGAKRILSGMVADTLALARKELSKPTKPLRIVLLDDEALVVDFMEAMIRLRFPNETVLTFVDPEKALRELAREDPDILVTNWMMPRLGGWEVLRLLAERKARFPVIVTSGHAREEDVRQCADPSLSVTFLSKPFSASRLIEAMEAALGIPPLKQRGMGVPSPASPKDSESLCQRGEAYYYGNGSPKDDTEAARWFRAAADRGCAKAQCWLGYFYTWGRGLPEDHEEAARWYGEPGASQWLRKAAESGDAAAQLNLGCCYEFGHGVSQDYLEAVNWYRRAAEQGYPPAQVSLGNCYSDGRGVPVDYTQASQWYRRAAEAGHATAQGNLGLCYESGRGVPQNNAEAVRWYQKAVEQGDKWAQYNLGRCYCDGIGVPRAHSEAARWLRKAADQGHPAAQVLLAALPHK